MKRVIALRSSYIESLNLFGLNLGLEWTNVARRNPNRRLTPPRYHLEPRQASRRCDAEDLASTTPLNHRVAHPIGLRGIAQDRALPPLSASGNADLFLAR